MKSLINEFNKEISESSKALESADIINRIFRALKLIFPAWKQAISSDKELNEIKQMWLQALIDENITTQEQIERGLRAAKLHGAPFFPSIGQFIKWTKKEKPRVNEQAYQLYKPKLPKHTTDEYQEFAKDGMAKLKSNLTKGKEI